MYFLCIEQERDSSFVVDSMADSIYRLHPKNRYFEASLFDKVTIYMIQFLPSALTDWLRLSFQTQLINLYR